MTLKQCGIDIELTSVPSGTRVPILPHYFYPSSFSSSFRSSSLNLNCILLASSLLASLSKPLEGTFDFLIQWVLRWRPRRERTWACNWDSLSVNTHLGVLPGPCSGLMTSPSSCRQHNGGFPPVKVIYGGIKNRKRKAKIRWKKTQKKHNRQ